jgi:hypothetical protein
MSTTGSGNYLHMMPRQMLYGYGPSPHLLHLEEVALLRKYLFSKLHQDVITPHSKHTHCSVVQLHISMVSYYCSFLYQNSKLKVLTQSYAAGLKAREGLNQKICILV